MKDNPLNLRAQPIRQDCFLCLAMQAESKNLVTIPELSDRLFTVAYDGYPITPGHVIIFPKRHVQYMRDLRPNEIDQLIHTVTDAKEYLKTADLQAVYKQMRTVSIGTKSEGYVDQALKRINKFSRPPESFNDGINDGPAAGQTIAHFHWHIMPRWHGDVEDPRGGVRNMFSGLGNYYEGIKFTASVLEHSGQ
jgi:diadenosine tetraphosphate (Ap4A) HIT family hydrolase